MKDKITTCFYFDGNAEEAVDFYVSLLPNSRVVEKTFYGPGAPLPAGTAMTIQFELQQRAYMAINGGPDFQFSPAISLVAYCDTQEELDQLWDGLADGGATMACGWLTDRFGISWQIVPAILPELMAGDAEQCNRVMQALWGMVKLDIQALQQANEAN
jgi:predicted 3-demethylubiquinone-9 3-methyltransferase (glyoxalase superfamily)